MVHKLNFGRKNRPKVDGHACFTAWEGKFSPRGKDNSNKKPNLQGIKANTLVWCRSL